ncbi:MAG: hypothetical protein FWE76_07495, partial [Symbiobacteriaceae bacterium]|nr:hypothetical protein [Symbiobacteriaceae bacterium]
ALRSAMKSIFGGWLVTDSNNNLGLIIFVFFVYYAVCNALWLRRANSENPLPKLRRITGLDAIDEAIGRATEMGRPVVYNVGTNAFTAATFASLATVSYVAQRAAHYDTRLIVLMGYPAVLPVAEQTVRQSYLEAGKPDAYRGDDVRFLTNDQFGYASGSVGVVVREKAAAHVMFGYFAAESLILAEAGFEAGAIQIAATTNSVQTPFFVASCDYTMLGEEIYVASAYLSKNRVRIATLIAQDMGKVFLVVLLVAGVILTTFGSTAIQDLMTLY